MAMPEKVPDSPSGDADAWDRQATTQWRRFLETDDLAALHRAIDLLRRAATGHPDRARLLSNLGGALVERFERGGQPADLDEAIEVGRAAVQVAPPDHRNRAGYLSNLGHGLVKRFEHVGELADLNEAVEAWRAAVRATPARHPDRAEYLGNLGVALLVRFERVGQLADLDEAVESGRAAVRATPARHPDRAGMLGNLGDALWARFERVGQRVDLNEAVQVRAAAVQATPTGHPHREIHLSNLDLALQALNEDDPPGYETVIMYVRPHWFGPAMRALRMPVLLVLMVVVVFFVPSWPDGKAILYHEKAILYVIIGVAAALLVKYSVLPWLQWVTTRYVVTTERLFVRKGLVLRRAVIDMPLSHIGEVESESFIIEHLFGGSGTLTVSSRDGRRRLELPNMPNVADVGDRLYRLAHRTGR